MVNWGSEKWYLDLEVTTTKSNAEAMTTVTIVSN